jgi:hypothetical protein
MLLHILFQHGTLASWQTKSHCAVGPFCDKGIGTHPADMTASIHDNFKELPRDLRASLFSAFRCSPRKLDCETRRSLISTKDRKSDGGVFGSLSALSVPRILIRSYPWISKSNTKDILDELGPLIDKQYSKRKSTLNMDGAVVGGAVVVGIALCFFNPFGLVAAVPWMGEAAVAWAGGHAAISGGIAAGGLGLAAVCGTKSVIASGRRKLMDEGSCCPNSYCC